jgi:chromosome segregation ATPase
MPMFVELPQNLILFTVGAFLLGWLISSLSSSLSSKVKARKRDPRDDRIRQIEAELRITLTDKEKLTEKVTQLEKGLKEATDDIEKRDNVISHQQTKVEKLTRDLRDSVMKTRELRAELSDRATENLRSEVKLREVETELEVAQASTDLIATGVLDYSLAPEFEAVEEGKEGDDDEVLLDEADMSKAAH